MKQKQLLRTLLVAVCLLVGTNAWADDVYEKVYTRAAVGDWKDDDKTDWNASSAVEVNATNGLGADANLTATYVEKTFIIGENSKVKYEVDWTFATATGRTGNWNWIQFGDFLRIAVNSTYNMQVSTDAGANWNATTLGYYYNATYTKHIEVVFDTQLKTVEKFTFDGTDRTSLVSGTFNNASFSTVSTGFVRGGSVSWTSNNYITTITVSEAKQAAATVAAYTINYKLSGTTVKKVEGNSVVGATVNAENPIVIDNVKYYATNETSTSLELSGGENVLNVELRKAYDWNWSLKDSRNKTVASGVGVEGESITAPYPAYYLDGTDLYAVPKYNDSNKEYRATFTLDSENKVIPLGTTTKKEGNVVYYSEAEEIGIATSAGGNMPSRSSNAKCGYADSDITLVNLPAGKYKIVAVVYSNSSGGATIKFQLGDENWDAVVQGTASNWSEKNTTFTLTSAADIKWLTSGSDKNGLDLVYIVQIPNRPTITTQPVGATYDVNATATALSVAATAADGGELSYQWYSNSNNSTDGAVAIEGATEISYTPSTTQAGTTTYYYCVVTEANNPDVATSDIVSVKINSAVCAAPTFTIGSYNYEEEGYAITPSCTTEGATLTYKIGNGADTECTNGVPFYAKEGKLVITASKNGWESASTPTEKQYTLNVAPSSTSPETLIPFVTGNDSGDKDLLHTYKSVSIPGTYFAGIDGNSGLKLRCQRKASSIEGVTYDFVLNVNSCYKVTKVEFNSLRSNRDGVIAVDAMYVDGEAVDGFTSFNIPASSADVISKEFAGLSATSQIVWKLTPGKYTDGSEEKNVDQFRATITVTYEANTIPVSISKYGYATFSSKYAVDFTDVDNAEAYIVTGKDDDNVVLQKIDGKVAAGTGLVLKSKNGAAANVTIPTTTDEGIYYNTTSDIKNYLFAVNDDYNLGESNNGTNYVLSVQDNDVVVFKPIRSVSAPVVAGHAALWIPASQGSNNAKALTMAFSNETTAINAINTVEPKADGVFYNLQGQRVSEPKQGIYVVNGKKVLVK